jgi:hypothetical protein
MEENGAGKDGESQRKKREEIEKNGIGWKKTERGEPTGSPYPGDSSFRSPLTPGTGGRHASSAAGIVCRSNPVPTVAA